MLTFMSHFKRTPLGYSIQYPLYWLLTYPSSTRCKYCTLNIFNNRNFMTFLKTIMVLHDWWRFPCFEQIHLLVLKYRIWRIFDFENEYSSFSSEHCAHYPLGLKCYFSSCCYTAVSILASSLLSCHYSFLPFFPGAHFLFSGLYVSATKACSSSSRGFKGDEKYF